MVKVPKNPKKLAYAKKGIREAVDYLNQAKGLSGVRVSIDVDPY